MAEGLFGDVDILINITAEVGIASYINVSLDTTTTLSDTFYSGFGLGSDLTTTFVATATNVPSLFGQLEESLNSVIALGGSTGIVGNITISQDTTIALSHTIIDGTLQTNFNTSLVSYGGENATGNLVESLSTIIDMLGTVSNSFGSLDTTANVLSMNTRTYGISEYSNYNFNSFFNIGSRYFGCSSTGLFEIKGDLDNTENVAQSIIKTGVSDYESQKLKSAKDCYVYIRSSGDNTLRLIVNEQTDRDGYLATYDNIDGFHRRRIKVAQGIKGTSWQLEFKNECGASFILKQIDIIPKELARSI